MNHYQLSQTKEKLDLLLHQYAEYNKATTEEERSRIGDSMMYDDPVVWMMYKHKAYLGGKHEITTVGKLREHCGEHGGICAKRFKFLSIYIMAKYSKNIKDPREFPDEMPIEDLYGSEILDTLVTDENLMHDWKQYEFYRIDNKVAKWQNYLN